MIETLSPYKTSQTCVLLVRQPIECLARRKNDCEVLESPNVFILGTYCKMLPIGFCVLLYTMKGVSRSWVWLLKRNI